MQVGNNPLLESKVGQTILYCFSDEKQLPSEMLLPTNATSSTRDVKPVTEVDKILI